MYYLCTTIKGIVFDNHTIIFKTKLSQLIQSQSRVLISKSQNVQEGDSHFSTQNFLTMNANHAVFHATFYLSWNCFAQCLHVDLNNYQKSALPHKSTPLHSLENPKTAPVPKTSLFTHVHETFLMTIHFIKLHHVHVIWRGVKVCGLAFVLKMCFLMMRMTWLRILI